MPTPPVFDSIADTYDQWYEAPEGKLLFKEEVDCLRCLPIDYTGHWLEVGVGTGRFAEALGVTHGIDLSPQMAAKAARRGIRVCAGRGEQLPFPDRCFDGVLMALTLCFLQDPETVLQECARILKVNGKLVIGTVPADSPWGRAYVRKGADGHPVYAHARFYTAAEIVSLVEKAGFSFRRGCSALFRVPDTPSTGSPRVETGVTAGAGFVGLLFQAGRFGV